MPHTNYPSNALAFSARVDSILPSNKALCPLTLSCSPLAVQEDKEPASGCGWERKSEVPFKPVLLLSYIYEIKYLKSKVSGSQGKQETQI